MRKAQEHELRALLAKMDYLFLFFHFFVVVLDGD
jgi:hypothetical protein